MANPAPTPPQVALTPEQQQRADYMRELGRRGGRRSQQLRRLAETWDSLDPLEKAKAEADLGWWLAEAARAEKERLVATLDPEYLRLKAMDLLQHDLSHRDPKIRRAAAQSLATMAAKEQDRAAGGGGGDTVYYVTAAMLGEGEEWEASEAADRREFPALPVREHAAG